MQTCDALTYSTMLSNPWPPLPTCATHTNPRGVTVSQVWAGLRLQGLGDTVVLIHTVCK